MFEVTEEAVVRFATDYPAGQSRASNKLRKERIVVYPWSTLHLVAARLGNIRAVTGHLGEKSAEEGGSC